MRKVCLITVLLAMATGGCARRYVPLALERHNYATQAEGSNGLGVRYSDDNVLAGNKRYAKKAAKKGIRFVPLQIHNPTADTAVVRATEVEVVARDGAQVAVVPFSAYRTRIKQAAWPYLLLLPLDFGYTSQRGLQYGRLFGLSPSNALLPVFTAWGIFNAGWAIKANRDFRRDFGKHQLDTARIAPGQTVYKVLAVRGEKDNALQVRLKR